MLLIGRLLLGQQNPWHHMLKNLKKVDCILHIGDQIYPDNEDIAHAGDLFGKLFDGLVSFSLFYHIRNFEKVKLREKCT